MQYKTMCKTLIAILCCAVTLDALAQSANMIVNQRKGIMQVQNKYMYRLVDMAQGKIPFDAAAAQRYSDIVAMMAVLPWEDFVPVTIGNPGTRAKEELYKEGPKFKGMIDKFEADTKAMAAAARSGNQANFTAAVRNVANSCNSCHDSYSGFAGRFKF